MNKLLRLVLAIALSLAWFGVSQPVRAAEQHVLCDVGDVTAAGDRIHVYCTNNLGSGIHYVAVPVANSELANRVLMLGTAAITSGKSLTVLFDPADLSGAAYGCQNSDCRPAIGVTLSN